MVEHFDSAQQVQVVAHLGGPRAQRTPIAVLAHSEVDQGLDQPSSVDKIGRPR